MYLEHEKKLAVQKELIGRSLVKSGTHPTKKYLEYILKDIDTRKAILDYQKVHTGTRFDTTKFNNDLYAILMDLKILYRIMDELSKARYTALESYINGYLNSLEEIAERADKKAEYELEATSLGADILYFTQNAPTIAYENQKAIITLSSIECEAQSKILAYINGTGFELSNVVFEFDGKYLSPYLVNRETIKNGGDVTQNTYEYVLPEESIVTGAFKIGIENFTPNLDFTYEIFGGKNKIHYRTSSTSDIIAKDKNGYVAVPEGNGPTVYGFYLLNASYITFDLSEAPEYRNFTEYDIQDLDSSKAYFYEFRAQEGSYFDFSTDGTVYATRETPAINNDVLYVANTTPATDFIVYEYIPKDVITYSNVSITIHNVEADSLHIDSIAIKQISDLEKGSRLNL